MAFENVLQVLAFQAAQRGEAPCLRFFRDGAWQTWSYGQVMDRVRAIAQGLVALGFEPGEHAAIVATPSPEWVVADLAIVAAGGVSLAVSPEAPPDDVVAVLDEVNVHVAFCGGPMWAERLLVRRSQLPEIQRLVLLAGDASHDDVMTVAALAAQPPTEVGGLPGILSRRETPLTALAPSVVLTHGDVLDLVEAIADGSDEASPSVAVPAFERPADHVVHLCLGHTLVCPGDRESTPA